MLRNLVLTMASLLCGCSSFVYNPHYNGPVIISPKQKCNITAETVSDPSLQAVKDTICYRKPYKPLLIKPLHDR
jgi:hypothetical protein